MKQSTKFVLYNPKTKEYYFTRGVTTLVRKEAVTFNSSIPAEYLAKCPHGGKWKFIPVE